MSKYIVALIFSSFFTTNALCYLYYHSMVIYKLIYSFKLGKCTGSFTNVCLSVLDNTENPNI